MVMFKFEKLEAWKKAVMLYEEVSSMSRTIDQRDQFSPGEQIRRAALSLSTNIAEGTGREGEKESRYLFNIAKGSVASFQLCKHGVIFPERDKTPCIVSAMKSQECLVAS